MDVVAVAALTYAHAPDAPGASPSLANINLALPAGSRTLLIGANGGKLIFHFSFSHTQPLSAGKSTLLQILSGKRLVTAPGASVCVKGHDVFRDTPPGISYLGTEWSVHELCNESHRF